jgi:hypothetical protein
MRLRERGNARNLLTDHCIRPPDRATSLASRNTAVGRLDRGQDVRFWYQLSASVSDPVGLKQWTPRRGFVSDDYGHRSCGKSQQETPLHAGGIMTGRVVSTMPNAGVLEAIELMTRNYISGLPVIDSSGALIGMVTE